MVDLGNEQYQRCEQTSFTAQSALDLKESEAANFTGTVSGIDKTMVGLKRDNTAMQTNQFLQQLKPL
jgi:hypothetical protein